MTKEKRVILFQGDSITDAGRSREGEPSTIMGQSYANLIAAQLGYILAEEQPLFINRGVSGDRVSDLYARWNEDAISLNPDVLSILIGVNDTWRAMSEEPSGVTDRFARAYRYLLEETAEVLPETSLILCEPFILKASATEAKFEAWQERLQSYQSQTRELAAEFGAIFVPLQEAFNQACEKAEATYWLYDGVHPTSAGHELIAREWLKVCGTHPKLS